MSFLCVVTWLLQALALYIVPLIAAIHSYSKNKGDQARWVISSPPSHREASFVG